MTTQRLKYTRAADSRLPVAGTAEGDRARDTFIGDLLDLFGATPYLWLPKKSDTTTTVDASRHAAVITYDASIASRISLKGAGVQVDFDGTNDCEFTATLVLSDCLDCVNTTTFRFNDQ